ncbi:hypothetical protein NEIG_00796 [Nematocida sp. ERTm5]|nr:hypothetical protein NEIRO02_0469 [Nematocida sp. AWRm79]KAI5182830.1 hypothetical protein NEIRO03_0472 [Nematocida sp. AWRm78]OAG31496.1 hypothetical protein NEIG_00796 [Nematocida sp. ERTm5]
MYSELTKDVLSKTGEVIVLGEVIVEEEDLLLQGKDGVKVPLAFTDEDVSLKHNLSDYEGEKVLIFGDVSNDSIQVIGHSSFKVPINEDLFSNTIQEMHKYPDIFDSKV